MAKIGNISFEKSVGAVIFRRENGENKFLLLKYRSSHWDFPKGHVDEGETEDETMKREVWEETGIKEINTYPGFRRSIFYTYKPKGKEKEGKKEIYSIIKRVVYYVCETSEKDIILSDEHRGYVWLEFDSAFSRVTHENGKKILLKAHHFLNKIK